jgi:hypothetical protein
MTGSPRGVACGRKPEASVRSPWKPPPPAVGGAVCGRHSVIHLIKIQFSFCLLQLGRVRSFELASMGHQNSVGPLVGYKHSLSEAAPNTAPNGL